MPGNDSDQQRNQFGGVDHNDPGGRSGLTEPPANEFSQPSANRTGSEFLPAAVFSIQRNVPQRETERARSTLARLNIALKNSGICSRQKKKNAGALR